MAKVGLSQLPLDVIDCPDRRLGRAALELAAELADGETEVSMLLPRRSYGKALKRILHDQTADTSSTREPALPRQCHHRPLHGGTGDRATRSRRGRPRPQGGPGRIGRNVPFRPIARGIPLPTIDGVTPIAALQWRRQARIAGRVKTLHVQPWSGVPTLECVLVDNSGESIVLVFLGRRSIPGIRGGTLMAVEAAVGKHHGKLAMINPLYEILSTTSPRDHT